MKTFMNLIQLSIFAMVLLVGGQACTNSGLRPADFATSATSTPSSLSSGPALKITLAQSSVSTGSSTTVPNFSLYFDNAAGEISTYCSATAAAGKPCKCRFTWSENNTAGGSTTEIVRNVRTAVSAVQPNLLACPAPSVFSNEISENTQLKISVEPDGSNTTSFSTNLFAYTKSTNNPVAGNFQDALGRAFLDIYRYTCYELNTIAAGVGNKVGQPIPHPDGNAESRTPIYSTNMCTSDSSSAQCTAAAGTQFSANSFYRNLFIRSTDVGGINSESALYKCPIVTESLRGNGPTYWPLDSSFSLALNKTQEYPIGVEAYSKVSIPGDPNSANATGCNPSSGSTTSSGSSNPLVKSCLGWALRPNSDGTCPVVQTTGGTLPTFRLRRFTAIFPIRFSAKGDMIAQPQSVDTVYIVDRPVKYSGYDPTNPKTMLGPKPCPVAILDHKGVATTQAAAADNCQAQTGGKYVKYYSTNSTSWNGKNVDGLAFPHKDTPGLSQNSMANTTFAVLTQDKSNFVIKSNTDSAARNYIRPVTAWAPHYEEDLDFRACAPLASQVMDPPLQLSRANATSPYTGWCSKIYPNFNPVASLLQTTEKTGCNSTRPYSGGFLANTITRTAATSSANWKNFPLVAYEADIQTAISPFSGDSSYRCQITKPSSTSTIYPSEGCCRSTTNATRYFVGATANSKHFEPSTSVRTCDTPYE